MPPASSSAASSGSTIPAAVASPTAPCSARSPARARLLRRVDAVLAHHDARRDELAVVAHARAGEDVLARLEVFPTAVVESVVLGFRRGQDLLLAVLVLHGELGAAADLCHAGDGG